MTEESPITAEELQKLCEDVNLEQLIKDPINEKIKEKMDEDMKRILYENLYDLYEGEEIDDSFFGKIKYGWRLFYLSYEDWLNLMVKEDWAEDFFWFLGRG